MTLSRDKRAEDVARALELMLGGLGEHCLREVAFNIQEEPFNRIEMTTWSLVAGQGLAKSTGENVPRYWLTPAGWLEALRKKGEYQQPDFVERAQKLAAALKSRVAGRQVEHLRGVLTDHWELTADTHLSICWILNALDSQLLDDLWPGRNMRVIHERKAVRVPIEFGQIEI